jgi:hypothetical protein
MGNFQKSLNSNVFSNTSRLNPTFKKPKKNYISLFISFATEGTLLSSDQTNCTENWGLIQLEWVIIVLKPSIVLCIIKRFSIDERK